MAALVALDRGLARVKERPEDKTILVVDDEPNVRQYLTTVLEDAGFTLGSVGSGVGQMERAGQLTEYEKRDLTAKMAEQLFIFAEQDLEEQDLEEQLIRRTTKINPQSSELS